MKFIKGRWFPLAIGIALVVLVGFVMFLFGWRITYAPELENSWDAISAVASWVGAIGTVAVLWYNHRSISLTQRSVQQAINLQLYEKRLELYTALSKNDAFKDTPLEIKIVYSEVIYDLYKQINGLCNRKIKLMDEFYLVFSFNDGRAEPCWNIGETQFQKYIKQLDSLLKGQHKYHKNVLVEHKTEIQKIQSQIRSKYHTLEMMMRLVLDDSIKNK